LPVELTPYLEQYLNNYRLRFAGAHRCDAVWLSAKGGVLCKEAIWDAVRRRTRERLGQAINLHLVRDIAATTINATIRAPVWRATLGHSKSALTGPTLPARRWRSRQAARVIAGLRLRPVVSDRPYRSFDDSHLACRPTPIHQGGATQTVL
jgi:hypothetical protein